MQKPLYAPGHEESGIVGANFQTEGEVMPKLSLVEVVKTADIEEAIDLLAALVQELIRRCDLRKGDIGPRGEPGVSNIPGPEGKEGKPGRDADVEEVIRLAENSMREFFRRELSVAVKTYIDSLGDLHGRDGRNGCDGITGQTGPRGATGQQGEPGKNGRDGATGPAGQRGEIGLQGITGHQGMPGQNGSDGAPGVNGITLEEVAEVVREIIGTSKDDTLKRLVAVRKEIGKIEQDPRYQRVHSVRSEIIDRLRQHTENQ